MHPLKSKKAVQLSAEEQALLDEANELAEECQRYVERLRLYKPRQQPESKPGSTLDQLLISLGAIDLIRGFYRIKTGITNRRTQ